MLKNFVVSAFYLIHDGFTDNALKYTQTKEMLEDSFDIMAQAGTYPLPPFYEDIVFRVAPQDNLDKKAVLAMRVGDYAIGQCT